MSKSAPRCGTTVSFTEGYVRLRLRDACDLHVGKQRGWARENGFSAAYVSDVLNERRDISANMAAALGFHKVVQFEPMDRAALAQTERHNG